MSKLPYPPIPELGFYDDDLVHNDQPVQEEHDSSFDVADSPEYKPEYQLEYTPQEGSQQGEEWDGTVLSSAFIKQEPHHQYCLRNEQTRQEIELDKSVLLGRRPSQDIPDGAKSVIILDPTRTVSRNHAAISFDQDGQLWIEDYGSLNGTYIIVDNEETQITKGSPVRLPIPVTVRIGDQLFVLEDTAK